MANNKVQLADGTTLIDLTSDTVTPQTMLAGTTAHAASGEQITGVVNLADAATEEPVADASTANVGESTRYAREDHRHQDYFSAGGTLQGKSIGNNALLGSNSSGNVYVQTKSPDGNSYTNYWFPAPANGDTSGGRNLIAGSASQVRNQLSVPARNEIYSMFDMDSHSVSNISVPANSYKDGNYNITKSGYYPLCIAGWVLDGNANALPQNLTLSNQANGSGKINYNIKNISSSVVVVTLNIRILWIKTS